MKALLDTQKHVYPKLQTCLNEVSNPRDVRYIFYNCFTLLGTDITQNICGISSIMGKYKAIPEKEKKGNPDLCDVNKNLF